MFVSPACTDYEPVKLQIEPDILPSSLEMMAKEVQMTNDQREIHRKKRVLEYAERIGNINKTCRHFGIARSPSHTAASLGMAQRGDWHEQ